MENNTPALRKQTVWLQALSLVSVLLATLVDNTWFMSTFSQTGGYIIMTYNLIAIVLSFIKPLGSNKKNLEVLDEPSQADDDYMKDF